MGEPAQGMVVGSRAVLDRWLEANPSGIDEGATFVVDLGGPLRLAPRRSEHVRCAGGAPVLAAGEIRFAVTTSGPAILEVTNQSTGYCPEAESWPAVSRALGRLGVGVPPNYTRLFIFRRCLTCGQLNVVKEDWFYCAVCDAPLPLEWNCDQTMCRPIHREDGG